MIISTIQQNVFQQNSFIFFMTEIFYIYAVILGLL